nr:MULTISPECIES: NepR family anti-sigma factor [unclassified Chelatococcus]
MQAQIGQQLRAVYDDILQQEVPDRFMKLLTELDARIGGTASAPDEPDEGGEKQ